MSTVAGNGLPYPLVGPVTVPSGVPATSTPCPTPTFVAVDGLGNLYISDSSFNVVRKVDALTGIITTVAGNGNYGFSGDQGPATAAQLSTPLGLAVDGLGNLFIADSGDHRIRRVDAATQIISTYAGTGVSSFGGDGGPATSAALRFPAGLALDADRNLYIADSSNQRIRRVDALTQQVSTVAGTGAFGYGGDGSIATSAVLGLPDGIAVDAAGTLYIGDRTNNRVRRVDGTTHLITTLAGTGAPGSSGDGGAAVSATLNGPTRVAVGTSHDVYVCDTQNNRIRRIDETSGGIDTIIGSGDFASIGDGGAATSAHLTPGALVVDASGDVLIADFYHHRIRRVAAKTGVISTIAGTGDLGFEGDGGLAISARMVSPEGLALDALGNLYIADSGDNRIRRVDKNGVITTVAGTGIPGFSDGVAISAALRFPTGLALDGPNVLYVADTSNHRVRRLDLLSGLITTIAGDGQALAGGDGGDAASAHLNSPYGLALDGHGTLFIADTANARVRKVVLATNIITTFLGGNQGDSGDGGPASAATISRDVRAIACDKLGNLYFADRGHARLRRVDALTQIVTPVTKPIASFLSDGDGGPASAASFGSIAALTFDDSGNLFAGNEFFGWVRKITAATGEIRTIAGAIDPDGMGPLTQARLPDPRALVVTPSFSLSAGGKSGTVQVLREGASWLGTAVGRYPQAVPTAALARFRSDAFGTVEGLAYDSVLRVLYLTETSNHRVYAVTIVDPADETTWTMQILANADGAEQFADGPAATARFRSPTGMFLDETTHTLYVADTGNHVVRAIDLKNGISAATVSTPIGTPRHLGFFGDGAPASGGLLYAPRAITRCKNGDLFVADTGNNRIRRIAAADGTITTVLGDGTAASSGQGTPARSFPVDEPLGVACDAEGNVYVTSSSTVRQLPAHDGTSIVDGSGPVLTIFGLAPRSTFPSSVTSCLTGIAVVDGATVRVTDACEGLLVELTRHTVP